VQCQNEIHRSIIVDFPNLDKRQLTILKGLEYFKEDLERYGVEEGGLCIIEDDVDDVDWGHYRAIRGLEI
jgi:hypothetical protein